MGKKSRSKWGPALVPALRAETAEGFRVRGTQGRNVFAEYGQFGSAEVSAGIQEAARKMTTFADDLEGCDLYWVSDAMAQMALEASHKMPLIDPADRPSRSGFLCFQKPLPPLPVVDGGWVRDAQGQVVEEVAAEGVVWVQHGDEIDVSLMVRPDRYESTFEQRTEGLGWAPLPFDEALVVTIPQGGIPDLNEPGSHGIEPRYAPVTAFVGAMWHLMSRDDLADTSQITPAPIQGRGGARSAGSRQGRGGRPPVTLVDMKPLRQERAQADRSGRVYTRRFVVSGHWRNQAYGPERKARRTTWIAPYIKGPKDAPLESRERVTVWRHM